MNKSDRPIRKFNPGTLQSDEEVKEQFVVRKSELGIVLEVLRENINPDLSSCQHVLVVAPRGQGKTMLLARVAAEVNTNNELSGSLLPVRFMEESHEIFNLADFWLDTLFYLAQESAKHNSALAEELKKTHTDLTKCWHEEVFADRVRDAVLEAADQLGKKLVLMVENLQTLCRNVDKDFGRELRGALQSEPQIMLLATATSRFEGLESGQPFSKLFQIVDLKPLNTEECRLLWQVVSDDAESKDKIKALKILTGGNPRFMVAAIARLAQHQSLRQLMEELMILVDDNTEYFRSRLEALGRIERRVYIAVLDLWAPSSPSEIGARARMDVRTVSTMLGRLVERGEVIVEKGGSAKKRRYAAAEGLYSIYYKLRRERDKEAVVGLIPLMTGLYSDPKEMSGKPIEKATRSSAIREGIKKLLSFPSGARPGIDGPSSLATRTYNKSAQQLVEEITTAFNKGEFEKVIETVDQAFTADSSIAWALLKKAEAHEKRNEFEAAIKAYDDVVSRYEKSDNPNLQTWVARALIDKGDVHQEHDQVEAAIKAYDDVVSRYEKSDNPDLQTWVAEALIDKGYAHQEHDQVEAAIKTYDNVVSRYEKSDNPNLQTWVARALIDKGYAHQEHDQVEAAIKAYDNVVSRYEKSDNPNLQTWVARALTRKGGAHQEHDQVEAAIKTYDDLIERYGKSDNPNLQTWVARALIDKGYAHQERDQVEAAIKTYDNVVSRYEKSDNPDLQEHVAEALLRKGYAHQERDQVEAVIKTYDNVVSRYEKSDNPNLQTWVARALTRKGGAHQEHDQFEAAIKTYDNVVSRYEKSDNPDLQKHVAEALINKGDAHQKRDQFEAAIKAYDDLIERYGKSDNPDLQTSIARALIRKGDAHEKRDQFEAAIKAYDDVVSRYGKSDNPYLPIWVTSALSRKGDVEEKHDQFEAAIKTYDDLIERYGKSDDDEVWVAIFLSKKGRVHEKRDQFEAAIKTYDDLIERYGKSNDPDLQTWIAWALIDKGNVHEKRDQFEAAIKAYDDVVSRYGKSDDPELQEHVAQALIDKGGAHEERDQFEAAIKAYDDVVSRYGKSDDPELQEHVAQALFKKGMRQIERNLAAAMATFCSAYDVFVPSNEAMMYEMLRIVPELIAAGASERDLVEILSGIKAKSDALEPLIVALQQRIREEVRAPAEVLEVAADIRERIEARVAQGAPETS